ncbi:uncharacterized protein PAC_02052 [Phialocephala subalpina]|uniref:F-box domain-containing protein n=1 Tax=Phialocephala subalpina TaxID=576137 RepID=A0A1L7WHE2_9HELO|nr:uncharacterized protein PAC_02052 [Phialocephala subalpina]
MFTINGMDTMGLLVSSKNKDQVRREHPSGGEIAKALFDLDLSASSPSTASKTPKPRNGSCPVASKPSLPDEVKRNKEITLLTLPVEIRLRIYDQILVSRFDRTQNPSWAVGSTDQKKISLGMIQAPQYRTMEPGILQTCKQINHEANQILYSQNVFKVTEPKQMSRLIAQIGLLNFRLIKNLHIWVPYSAELSSWLQLLHILAEEAIKLRYIELGWGEFPWQFHRGAMERGLGDNLDFVRALAKIQGLEKLVITGHYAKNWHSYLSERMGGKVQAICGDCREEPKAREEELNEEELDDLKWMRKYNENQMKTFGEYQQGTEYLIP